MHPKGGRNLQSICPDNTNDIIMASTPNMEDIVLSHGSCMGQYVSLAHQTFLGEDSEHILDKILSTVKKTIMMAEDLKLPMESVNKRFYLKDNGAGLAEGRISKAEDQIHRTDKNL